MMKQHVELHWTFGLAWKIIMFILIVCTCGIGPQAVFTYPDRSGSVVWAAYCAFCATWPHLRGFNCSINGTNSRALIVDQLKSGRRRVTVWTGRQWSYNDGPPSCSATKGWSPQGWQAHLCYGFFIVFFYPANLCNWIEHTTHSNTIKEQHLNVRLKHGK
ncbi:hypothetical protein D917_02807 [Trichinella nativa]|uniref:Uncharacterized protein n=1 Tax=Trichinella nativa TaxID=6335 RepID=A0A1Y3EC67_9BILA|nr:hypothetical protein D917_02807 [Trichinella nativa]